MTWNDILDGLCQLIRLRSSAPYLRHSSMLITFPQISVPNRIVPIVVCLPHARLISYIKSWTSVYSPNFCQLLLVNKPKFPCLRTFRTAVWLKTTVEINPLNTRSRHVAFSLHMVKTFHNVSVTRLCAVFTKQESISPILSFVQVG